MLTPVTGSTLEFAARTTAVNENMRLMIEYSDDGDAWTTLGTAIELPQQGPWELYSFDLSSLDGDDYFLSFSVYSEGSSTGTVYLDYVRGPEIALVAPNAVTLNAPADEAEDVNERPTFSWNLMSLPADNIRVRELAAQNHVQGVTGANAFYGRENYDEAASNLLLFVDLPEGDGEFHDGYRAPTNFSSRIEAGQGFVWFFFDEPAATVTPLPFMFNAIGLGTETGVTRSLNTNTDFTLIGNPFTTGISPSGLSGDIQAGAQVWREGSFVPLTNSTDEIQPFEGMFVEKNEDGDVTIDPVLPGAGRGAEEESEVAEIAFMLTGVNEDGYSIQDHATRMVFNEDATDGWDLFDLTKIGSLNYTSVNLSLSGERNGELVNKVVDSRPLNLTDQLEVPLDLQINNFSGDFELEADFTNLPEEWTVELIDNLTGVLVNLRTESHSLSYDAGEVEPKVSPMALREIEMPKVNSAEGRFTVIVVPAGTSTGPGNELPQELALNQNYPNPFNPTTQISYDLPETADVRLDVFNVQGQRVATLVNSSQNAGTHSISFDATNLSSGVYLYRLQAGNTVLTRKMTLVK